MLQFHMWLSFLHPQGVSLQKDRKGLNSYKSSCSFESYIAKQMLYREREHPLKTIWCLLIDKNSVLGVLQQEKRRKAHVDLASWVKTCRFHPRALLRSRFCIALLCQHFALSCSDIWQDLICLCWGWVALDQAPSHSPAHWCCPVDI